MKQLLGALTLASLPAMLAAQAPALAPVPTDRLTVDLFWEYETVAEPQISPDGSHIIYTRRWFNKLNDRRESSLWIMNADGTRHRFLVAGSNARWSPSGDRILYTSQGQPRGSQIFVRYMDAEGATSQITRVDESPIEVTWSPEGSQIAFTMAVVKRNSWPIKMPGPPEGGRWTDGPRIVERLQYRQDGEGFTDDRYRHVFVVPATGGTARQLTTGNWNHSGLEWTPDSREILFSSLRVEEAEHHWRESDIYAVALANGEIRQLTTRKGPDGNPSVSPNGKLVAYTGYDWTLDTYIDSKIYLVGIDGSNPRVASGTWDRSPRDLRWKGDGSGIYFSAFSEGTANFHFLPVSGPGAGTVRPVTEGTHILNVGSMTKTGKVAAVVSSFQTPPDVVSFEISAPKHLQTLTAVNADILAGRKLGDVKEIRYTAPDGLEIQGWYITPPDFNPSKQYPMQLHIHGGPHGMYGVGFSYAWQEQAANDYVILYTNPRGSTGYGSAFGNQIMNAYPGKDYDDLMAGVDALLKKGFVDKRNMFVTGCSGGGVLTAWIVGHTDRFAAASANCPVIDWVSFVGSTDGAGWYRNFEKLPWEDPSEHLRRSPLTYVGNVKTPTMLMTGELDLRTPMSQTEQFYSALAYLKVPTAMVRFVNEYHDPTNNPSNFIRTQLILRHWFERHSRPPRAISIAQP